MNLSLNLAAAKKWTPILVMAIIGVGLGILVPYIPNIFWFGIFGIIVGIAVFWRKPDLGLVIIIVTLPIYFYAAVNIAGLNIRIYNAISIILMVVLLLRRKWRFEFALPVLIYLFSISLSVATSLNPILSLKYILFQIFGFLLMWVTFNLVRSEKDFEKYIYLLLLVGNIDVILIMVNTLLFLFRFPTFAPIMFTDVLPIGRPNLFLGEPDRTAEYHLVLFLICFPLVVLSRYWKGKYYLKHRFILISCVLNLYIIVIGLFRSAWFGVAVGVFAYFLIAGGNRIARIGLRRLIPLIILSGVLLGLLLLIYEPFTTAVVKRINEAINLVLNPDFDVQTDITVVYTFFISALQRPWLGWGIGYDEVAINPAEVFVYHLPAISEGYNRIIRLFYGAGIVGIVGFLIWQIAYIRRLLQGKNFFAYRLAMLLPVIGIYWGHDILRAVGIMPMIFLVMGLGLALRRITPVIPPNSTTYVFSKK